MVLTTSTTLRVGSDDREMEADFERIEGYLARGRTYLEVAAELGWTVGQLRYRLRKYREAASVSMGEPESAVLSEMPSMKQKEPPLEDPYNIDRWVSRYDDDLIVILPKSPSRLFAYWDVSDRRKRMICECFQCDWSVLPKFLRCYDVTDIHFSGYNAHRTIHLPIHHDATDWFINDLQPGRHYIVDYGTTTIRDQFFAIVRSNVVALPRSHPLPAGGLESVERVDAPPLHNDEVAGIPDDELFGARRGHWHSRFNGYSLT